MAAEKYVSLKVVADKLLRNPLLDGISFEAILDYTIDFLHIVGVPADFIDKLYTKEFSDYRAELPDDYVECTQLLIDGKSARWATDTFHTHYGEMETVNNYNFSRKLPRAVDTTLLLIIAIYIFLKKKVLLKCPIKQFL